MTKAQIIDDLKTRDSDWLASRWSVLNQAIEGIEPHLAELDVAFDHDYTASPDGTLEEHVSDQVIELCNIVMVVDVSGVESFQEIRNLIDQELQQRVKLCKSPGPPQSE